jgi:hypothetical protein
MLYIKMTLGETVELAEFTRKYTLEKDGVYAFPYTSNWKEEVLNMLPPNYEFLNYMYSIRGCSLTTFHRDVTSGQYANNTRFPTYTVILYKYSGDHCSVCPGSHESFFLFSFPVHISSDKHCVVIFDCDVVHAGALNTIGADRIVDQFKVAHVRDIPKLQHLHDVYTDKIGQCDQNHAMELFKRNASYQFSYILNHVCTPLLQTRHSNGILAAIQHIFLGQDSGFFNNAHPEKNLSLLVQDAGGEQS